MPFPFLRVAAVQMSQYQGDLKANTERLRHHLSSLTKGEVDLVVLPEMWNTGFEVTPSTTFEEAYEQGVEEMKRVARDLDCAVYGSIIQFDKKKPPSNQGIWVQPNGSVTTYQKVHLFAPGGEAEHFAAGQERITVNIAGWRVRLAICYDLRFPVWLRYTHEAPYDLLLVVANWPESRSENWEILLKARAIENQSFVIGCNRVGPGAGRLHYSGDSLILNARGEAIKSLKKGEEGLLRATLNWDELKGFRLKFPVLNDLDPFVLTPRPQLDPREKEAQDSRR